VSDSEHRKGINVRPKSRTQYSDRGTAKKKTQQLRVQEEAARTSRKQMKKLINMYK